MSVLLDSNWSQRAPSFPPLSCIGCIGCDTPLAEADIFGNFVYCRCWCWCHVESVSNGRTDERTGCMFLLLYFCLLLRRACSRCVLYIPTCLSVEAYMLLAGAGQMDGWIPPPHPRDTRRWRRQEGDENGEEMHNTYLPTYLLTYPYVCYAFCQDLAHCSTYTHPPRCASRRDTPPPQCTSTNCEMTSCVSPVDNLPIAIQDVMGCTR